MFFRPTPSKLDQAKQAARDAASAVRGAAAAAREAAGDVTGTIAGSAHSLLEQAPKIAAGVGEAVAAKASVVSGAVSASASSLGDAVAAKASSVGESLSGARDIVAARMDAVRHRSQSETDDAVEAAAANATKVREAADSIAAQVERAAREAQTKAETERARIERELAAQRAEFERDQIELRQRNTMLEEERAAFKREAAQFKASREATTEAENSAPSKAETAPVEVFAATKAPYCAPVRGADDGFEYQVVAEKQGGSKLWILLGGAVFVGAALVYFFAPSSGRRSRAAIKDRLAKVKDQAVDRVTGAADAASTTATEQMDTLAEATLPVVAKVQNEDFLGDLDAAVATEVDAPAPTVPSTDEAEEAFADGISGVAVEAYEPPDQIETATTDTPDDGEPQHPNIFDKVAGIVGTVAGVAENLAGEEKDGAKETAERIEVAAEEAKHETKKQRGSSTKKK